MEIKNDVPDSVSTHSRPKAAVGSVVTAIVGVLFQHTAA